MDNIFSDNPTWTVGIIFGLLGIIITYRLYLQRDKQNRINEASQKLITTFNKELADIYPLPVNWPTNIDAFLRYKFPNLQTAVDQFRCHLPKRKQKYFTTCWIAYYNSYGDDRCQCYHHYMPFTGASYSDGIKISEEDNTKTYKDNFKHNVDNLLEYAKKT